jgi:hypothetical protein
MVMMMMMMTTTTTMMMMIAVCTFYCAMSSWQICLTRYTTRKNLNIAVQHVTPCLYLPTLQCVSETAVSTYQLHAVTCRYTTTIGHAFFRITSLQIHQLSYSGLHNIIVTVI